MLKYYRTLRFVRGGGYIWRGVGGVVGVVRVGEWRLGAGCWMPLRGRKFH